MAEIGDESGDSIKRDNISQISAIITDKLNKLDLNDLIIQTKDLSFCYDAKKGYLLKDLNMTFPRSAIYGFLGSSGCGKTTLIKLLMGELQPTVGSIRINGKNRSHPKNKIPGSGVGYMPQELSLYNEFTILETFRLFAKLYGMSTEYTKTRIEFLIKFLELPDQNRMIHNLSGGQKRKTSLAVALLHNPPLLILDEPTVGVDPMLRERIWQLLLELSSTEKTSIMITTHHIEECRRAHVIALIRSGRLLLENSPLTLMKYFKTNNLEDVFIQSCKFGQKFVHPILPPILAQVRKRHKPKAVQSAEQKSSSQQMNSTFCGRYSALVIKNAKKLWRQKLLLIVLIIAPIISGILLCITFGNKPHNLKVAVCNQELKGPANSSNGYLSLKLLAKIDKKIIDLVNYESDESALDSVRNSKTYGALLIPKGFSNALMIRAADQNHAVTDDQLYKSTVEFFGDASDLMIYQAMGQALLEAEQQFMKILIEEMGQLLQSNPKATQMIIKFIDPPIFGSLDPPFREFAAPGLLILNTYLFSMAATALNIVGERIEGTINRTLMTGVRFSEIILALISIQFLLTIIQTISLLYITIGIFHIKNDGNLVLIVCLIFLQNINGMTYGLMISSISSDKLMAFQLCVGSFLTFIVISSVIWPLEGMHYILRKISLFSPQTLPIISLRSMMLKGWGLDHVMVWSGFFVSFGYLILFIFFARIFSSFKN